MDKCSTDKSVLVYLTAVEVGETRPIQVLTANTGKPNEPCLVTDIGPRGDTKNLPVKKIPEGYETLYAPLEVGPHKIKVEYAGREIPKSPIPVEVQPKSKEGPVKVKGLEARMFTFMHDHYYLLRVSIF